MLSAWSWSSQVSRFGYPGWINQLNSTQFFYFSGDNQRVRNSLADLQANIDRLVSTVSEIGNLNKQFNEQVDRESFNQENMKLSQADIAQIPIAEAAQNLNAAQTVLGYTMQSSSRIMQQNIFDFI